MTISRTPLYPTRFPALLYKHPWVVLSQWLGGAAQVLAFSIGTVNYRILEAIRTVLLDRAAESRRISQLQWCIVLWAAFIHGLSMESTALMAERNCVFFGASL